MCNISKQLFCKTYIDDWGGQSAHTRKKNIYRRLVLNLSPYQPYVTSGEAFKMISQNTRRLPSWQPFASQHSVEDLDHQGQEKW